MRGLPPVARASSGRAMTPGRRRRSGAPRSPVAGRLTAGRLAAGALALLAFSAVPVDAQLGMRGWATTHVRYVELRPMVLDTVTGLEPRPEWCVADLTCTRYLMGAKQGATIGTQDVALTAWGFGVEGLSGTLQLRARDQLGGEFDWPLLTDDRVTLLTGYLQYRDGPLRVRLGRQATTSTLGFRDYDGAAALLDGGNWWAEAFGGRSLARALISPRRDAFEGLEQFVPDENALLVGGVLGLRGDAASVSFRYQREILRDRSALLVERAAVEGQAMLPAQTRVRGSADWDFTFSQISQARLTLEHALTPRILVEVGARRYRPYFDLSTIWGFFSPVGFNEARVGGRIGLGPSTGIDLSVAAREYDETGATSVLSPLRDQGVRVDAGVRHAIGPVGVDARYEMDWGNSQFLHGADLSLRWSTSTRWSVGVTGTTLQQIAAYRLGDGRAWGGGVDARWEVVEGVEVSAGGFLLRQDAGRDEPGDIWNQTRASMALRYAFGADPALREMGR